MLSKARHDMDTPWVSDKSSHDRLPRQGWIERQKPLPMAVKGRPIRQRGPIADATFV